jgi:DNA-binding NtrC family response regulator
MTKPCVLIIDDEANLVSSVAYGLGAHGFDGVGAGTGAEGLAVAEKRQPRAILLDQKLPDASGIDLIAPLRSLDNRVAIIMIFAHGDIPTAVEAVRRGAYDFVTKPFELDDLVGVLRSALSPGTARAGRAAPCRRCARHLPARAQAQAEARRHGLSGNRPLSRAQERNPLLYAIRAPKYTTVNNCISSGIGLACQLRRTSMTQIN